MTYRTMRNRRIHISKEIEIIDFLQQLGTPSCCAPSQIKFTYPANIHRPFAGFTFLENQHPYDVGALIQINEESKLHGGLCRHLNFILRARIAGWTWISEMMRWPTGRVYFKWRNPVTHHHPVNVVFLCIINVRRVFSSLADHESNLTI